MATVITSLASLKSRQPDAYGIARFEFCNELQLGFIGEGGPPTGSRTAGSGKAHVEIPRCATVS